MGTVRRATPDKRYRHDALLARAGAGRVNTALALFDRLLVDGLAEVEERRDPQRGWQAHSLRFRDPAALRRALALPEPDAAQSAWDERRSTTFAHPELETARAALDPLPPATALARMDLLAALERWSDEGRGRGLATRRDFAWFARADTKKLTDTELRTMLRTAETPERSVPEQSCRTLIELPTLERQGRHGEIIEQRKHLRAQHAELFDYYMQNRA